MCTSTNQINKIKVSELENLKTNEIIEIENDISFFGFTKVIIFDEEYLVFGLYAGNQMMSVLARELDKNEYKQFVKQINKKHDINLELIFDIEIQK